MKRKLTSILAADIVGFSRLIEMAEEATLTRQKMLRQNVFDAALVFPDPAPVLRYIGSCRSWLEERLPDAVTWDEVIDRMEAIVRRESDENGIYRVSKRSGAFVASKA